MSPERWQRVKELFEGALACQAPEREAFLRGATEDAEVLMEVASLIAFHDRAGDFIQRPAVALLRTLPRADEF